ncbi:MAG: M20/M25/M40 family metallo-hydrolase, partial [Pseudomonadota bacterium]
VRFQPPMLGSGAFVGAHDADWALAQADEDGVTLAAALERAGFAGDAAPRPEDYDGCFELHIEQGPELEAAGAPVGVVAGAFTSFGADILVRGENAHTGPTPMSARRNALLGAAVIIAELDAIAWAFQPHGRSACARIAAAPNRYGVLAHRAEITVDVRHADPTAAAAMFERVRALLALARRGAATPAEIVKSWSFGADLAFDPGLRAEIMAAAAALGVACREMTSIAGHDAYHLARAAPTALIFSPCRGGVTHNEAESITLEATEPAVNVLLHAALRRADRA